MRSTLCGGTSISSARAASKRTFSPSSSVQSAAGGGDGSLVGVEREHGGGERGESPRQPSLAASDLEHPALAEVGCTEDRGEVSPLCIHDPGHIGRLT